MTNGDDSPILIIGAGPVGLTLACELLRHDVPCRLVEKEAERTSESRALAVHSRTMEVLEDMGCLDDVLRRGLRMHGFNAYAGSRRLAHISFDELDAPYPFVLILPQYETEQALARHLTSLGGTIERGVEATGLSQTDDAVRVELADGSVIQAPWCIGCDGAHSIVRKEMGLDFEGKTYIENLVLIDADMETSLARDEGHVFFSDEGVLACFPLPEPNQFRLILQFPPERETGPVTIDQVEDWLAERTGRRTPVLEILWSSAFRIHRRIVTTYRRGRVFLAGDAAHIHSPAGGQGMNLGMQDAYNLAWKLALVHRGLGREELLASYEEERIPIAQQILSDTNLATEVVLVRHPISRRIRNLLARSLLSIEVVQRRIVRRASEIAFHYRSSSIVGEDRLSLFKAELIDNPDRETPTVRDWLDFGSGPPPGDRAPDVAWHEPPAFRLHEWIRGTEHVLLLFDGKAKTPEGYENLSAIAEAVQRRWPGLVRCAIVLCTDETPGALTWEGPIIRDSQGHLHKRYGARAECLYLIRPDGYVGFRGQPARPEPLLDHLERLFPSEETS